MIYATRNNAPFARALTAALGLMILPACAIDSPQIGKTLITPTPIVVDGATFRIFRQRGGGSSVEAHRINVMVPPPSRTAIVAKAAIAITQATGCPIKAGSLVGDQALVKAELDCSN
ncbi:hypothetical protein [Celeribacter marinus]|uniref:hypothetical protein n=1 Tax=Celeribacter marinus TaxID=1397108 RepID=UPI003171F6B2